MTRHRNLTRGGLAAIVTLALGFAVPASAQPGLSPAGPAPHLTGQARPVDGRIAFWSDDCQIYTINPDGSAVVQVTHFKNGCAVQPSWSPDGSRIVFERFTSNFDRSSIYSVNADGSDLRLVLTDGVGFREQNPAYTPDGTRIMYGRCRPDPPFGCAIYSVRPDGSDVQQVTSYPSVPGEPGDWFPQVSPDGKWLAYSRLGWNGIQAQIWLLPMDRSAPAHPITSVRLKALGPSWTPDSRHVYFSGEGSNGLGLKVFRTSISGSHVTQLTFAPWPNGDYEATSSPSGRYVAFGSDRRYPDANGSDLFLMHADGSHQHLVTSDPQAENPDWGTASLIQGPTNPVLPPTAAELARFHQVQALQSRLMGQPAWVPWSGWPLGR